ncbi:MAG: hypothetical protein WCD70_01895 [Alphaproteobacteria bacterium]
MKRRFLLMALCGLLDACAPTNSMDVVTNKMPEMQEAKQSCAESTKDALHPCRAAANCTYDAWAKSFKDAGFLDLDLLGDYNGHVVTICINEERGVISEEKAYSYTESAYQNFLYNLKRRDAERTQRYTAALIAAGQGLNQAHYYSPPPSYAPVSQPSMPSMPPMTPVDTTLQDNYLRETQASQQPQPSIAQKLRDCSQAPNGCNGAFAR